MLSEKQNALYEKVIKQYPILKTADAAITDNVLIKIQNMPVIEHVPTDKIDISKEFNDIIYPPQKKFLIPPVSYLDTKQHYWTHRKATLIKRFGYMGKTIDGVLGSGMMASINKGASFFDPVLCEVIISWFGLPQGRVLNPFCGEASIGIIAGEMGCDFVGVDIRRDQVAINNDYIKQRKMEHPPRFIHGNSLKLKSVLLDNNVNDKFDLVFSSPPYYDLEMYSGDAGDLSNKQTFNDFMKDYYEIFKQAVDRLNDNRFLVVKVGEIRDEGGINRNFIGANVFTFKKLGLNYYNEIILLNQFGTAPMRFNQNFRTRKIVKLHQNVLVFFKGDVKQIPHLYKEPIPLIGNKVTFRKDLF
ncbi:MAG: hypothetical protein CMI54_03530 [Parcubacteria group bacterium]|mgnify:CR=1 FL=1|nr:hypothetical protein [Parcubacteria group bacterium]|tara:strand:- start:2875 stop:3948 length:1074 start_codon:yes stop_codon:yes gene_type:complete